MQLRQEPPYGEETADLALTYRFGPFLLDVPRRRLFSGATVKTLPEKPFSVLMLLLEANGRVVERHVFFERLWPGDPVGDANLTQHVFMLRNVLGEQSGDNEYVVTVSGKGYRLAMPVEKKLGLAMKGSCERCGRVLKPSDDAYICSYECTFCFECGTSLGRVCPNCGGEQVARPRR
jgi:DNA-binding winged helix-turn-helix (wHTH) protein